ncbi:ribosomal protein S18 acetylase RimI-like enzyme [Paenibacillus castaneae]|uniref:GNAT family N-acetyltransferase n=1 Tax=Paenibacillus castaneae TaxID=474957 RepID=UPI000C9C03DA|nr:GNAT family N-acetyltransferase [Paenibacillus castaneae]NIK76382.1 ribosomal protein S18 acetylase RimI-like enzyme [Paenibacillus castaneae]
MKIIRTTDFELVAKLNKPIHDLHVSLYPEHFTEYSFGAMRDAFERFMQNESFSFFIVEDNNEPLGYAWIEIKNYSQGAFVKQRKSLFVHQISIVENQKRKGYGSFLMNYIYDFAKSEGIEMIELDYWTDNEHAKNFYDKQGFAAFREYVYKKI